MHNQILQRYEHQPLFTSALQEILHDVLPYLESKHADDSEYALLERLTIPERSITFKVIWEDDAGIFQHNLGYRIQFNSALGPYKGGLRFDASVTEDVLKFLGFEQIFKNALTGLPLGGGKGGSDFDPRGKSDAEIRRFCVAFIGELARHIGPRTDVPAGDIGVGAREIGYMYGAYKKLVNETDETLTGKGVAYGGSYVRTEATGYGAVYFVQEMLAHIGKEIQGMRVVVSGSGNVATHVVEKLIQLGAVPLTLSGREGYIYAENGITQKLLDEVKKYKAHNGGTLEDVPLPEGVSYRNGNVWNVPAHIYMPSATQHEIHKKDAESIVAHGGMLVAECANMPSTLEAIEIFKKSGIVFGPAKAVNAGGVAVSGLEMSQNAIHTQWTAEEVDTKLKSIMKNIHATCVTYGKEDGHINYSKGANIGGFVRVFEAMKQLGW